VSRYLKFLISVGIAGIFLAQTNTAWPCSCGNRISLEKEFARTDVVFFGTAVEKIPDKRHLQTIKSDGSVEIVTVDDIHRVEFIVDRALKGDIASKVSVATSTSGPSCGYYFHLAARYLVYAYKDDDGFLSVSVCSRTKPYDEAAEELKQLNSYIEKTTPE
jgi:hypothetical protein